MAKKKDKKKIFNEIQELSGYKIGGFVYTKSNSGELYYGKIIRFYPKNKTGPAFLLQEFKDYKYIASLISNIIDKPTAKQKKKFAGIKNDKK